MKLEKFLNESVTVGTTTYSEKEIGEFLKFWEKNKVRVKCKEFIRELTKRRGKRLMYRGSNRSRSMGRKKTRDDRMPKDMPREAHEALDDAFNDIYGWRARSSGLFCTGREATAKGYGDAQIVFPIGGYEYLWSASIDDLYSFTDDGNEIIAAYDEYDERDWESEWEDQYSEGGDGYWWYEGNSYSNDKYDAINDIRYERIQPLKDELEAENDEEEPDEDRISDLQDQIYYIDSTDFEYEIEGDMEWIPDVELEDFMDEKRAEYEDDEKRYDIAANIIRGVYNSNKLDQALSDGSGTEIMVNCKEYFFFSVYYRDLIVELLYNEDFDPRQEEFDFMKR